MTSVRRFVVESLNLYVSRIAVETDVNDGLSSTKLRKSLLRYMHFLLEVFKSHESFSFSHILAIRERAIAS